MPDAQESDHFQEEPVQLSPRQKHRSTTVHQLLLPDRERFDGSTSETTPIFASPRPYSTPDATLSSYHNQMLSPQPDASSSRSTNRPDRHSSASLSAPSQIPFYALPRVSSNAAFSGPAMPQSDFDSNTKIPSPFRLQFSLGESVPLSASRTADRPFPFTDTATMSSSSSDSSFSSSNASTSSYTSNPTSQGSVSDLPLKHSSTDSNNPQPRIIESSSSSPPPPRPVSPFRAPQPPPHQQPSGNALSQPTAIRSYMMPLHDATSYPPPDPPVILPTENSTFMNQSSFQTQAPYFPFLSHAPPPENSWIEVETLQNEYRLQVRLPGFTREGITLATKRRRILHVVADKWENGGGKSLHHTCPGI